ncbi:MAG: AMP-binding protein [Archangiaceae bacterium]|nr:AMP-binding protein [Archangiaceae bacterium]
MNLETEAQRPLSNRREQHGPRLEGPPLEGPTSATVNQALKLAAATAFGLTLVDAQEHERRFTWAELHERARRAAAALLERGVKPGDRVAMVLPTGLDFMDAFFGTLLAGAVPVPLYPPVRLGRMDEYVRTTARMLELTQARAVLSDRRVRLLLGGAVERARPDLGCPTVAELLEGSNASESSVTPDALGLIQFSSGSTVDPKPVALTHANLMAQVAMLRQVMPEIDPTRDRGVSWLPLYHDMGLIGCLLEAVYYPGDLVLLPPEAFLARPALWLRAISRHHGGVSPAPNFAYGLCLKRVRDEDLEGVDLSCWKYALNGAEPISQAVQQRFNQRFARWGFNAESLLPVYGLSEASLAVSFTQRGAARKTVEHDGRELVSVGVPVPGTRVEVREGRIWVSGPSVMKEYFDTPEATERALVDGWLDTGDLGFIEDGELFVSGRAKDIIIIRGANHAPQAFEECLDSVTGVRTGCAVAVGYLPRGHDGEALALLVEGEGEGLEQRITTAVLERTGIKPHAVVVLQPGTLPRTSSGKLRRQEALRRWLAGELAPPKPTNALNVGAEVAKSMLAFAKSRLK